MCLDALTRSESCGGRFQKESQTLDGEALRDVKNFTFVSACEYTVSPYEASFIREI